LWRLYGTERIHARAEVFIWRGDGIYDKITAVENQFLAEAECMNDMALRDKWVKFYDVNSDVRTMVHVYCSEGLSSRPWPYPDNEDERVDWAIKKYEQMQKMRELVMAEMENSRVMIALCGKDSRLGYHSEAEVYKFFPEKIEDRIAQLTELLDTEFAEVEERIRNGKTPLEYYDGVEDNDDVARYTMVRGTLENAEWTDIDSGYQSKFRMAYDASHVYFELYCDEKTVVTITPEFNLMHPGASVLFYANNTMGLVYNAKRHLSVFGETEEAEYARYQNRYISSGDETHIRITFDRKDIGLEVMRPFRMHINAGGSWSKGAGTGSQDFRPGADIFGWILPQ